MGGAAPRARAQQFSEPRCVAAPRLAQAAGDAASVLSRLAGDGRSTLGDGRGPPARRPDSSFHRALAALVCPWQCEKRSRGPSGVLDPHLAAARRRRRLCAARQRCLALAAAAATSLLRPLQRSQRGAGAPDPLLISRLQSCVRNAARCTGSRRPGHGTGRWRSPADAWLWRSQSRQPRLLAKARRVRSREQQAGSASLMHPLAARSPHLHLPADRRVAETVAAPA